MAGGQGTLFWSKARNVCVKQWVTPPPHLDLALCEADCWFDQVDCGVTQGVSTEKLDVSLSEGAAVSYRVHSAR